MSGDCEVKPAKPDKEQLTRKYGAEVASKLLSFDADIWLLYKRAVDLVGQNATQIAQLAEPLCRVVADAERQRRRHRWQRLMLWSAVIIVLVSCLVACDTSYQFLCAVMRILWIKVDRSLCVSPYGYCSRKRQFNSAISSSISSSSSSSFVIIVTCLKAMSGDCDVKPAKPDNNDVADRSG